MGGSHAGVGLYAQYKNTLQEMNIIISDGRFKAAGKSFDRG